MDLCVEVNNLISVQTLELNQIQQSAFGYNELRGMIFEVCRVVNLHGESLESLNQENAVRDRYQQGLVSQLNVSAGQVVSQDESHQFFKALAALESSLGQQRASTEILLEQDLR